MLKYHNDGKERYQSHEFYESDFNDIATGYGETKEQAFENFKHNVKVHIENLQYYFDTELKIEHAIKVDCLGNQ